MYFANSKTGFHLRLAKLFMSFQGTFKTSNGYQNLIQATFNNNYTLTGAMGGCFYLCPVDE